uniref:Secreted protein n=1 Tax=Stegastes partitus TaxID=144197 RepID=A0A3B5BEP3_9TELE
MFFDRIAHVRLNAFTVKLILRLLLMSLDVVHSNVLIHGKVQRDPRAHRCVLGDLQTRLFPGELGGVVVDVLDLHLDVDEFELLFGEADHVESDEAVQGVFADPLPVYPLSYGQLPVALPQTDERRVELFHHPEIATCSLCAVPPSLPSFLPRPAPARPRLLSLRGDGR